jgi:hypothetical protein
MKGNISLKKFIGEVKKELKEKIGTATTIHCFKNYNFSILI